LAKSEQSQKTTTSEAEGELFRHQKNNKFLALKNRPWSERNKFSPYNGFPFPREKDCFASPAMTQNKWWLPPFIF